MYSERVSRKNEIETPRKSESHLRLFGSVGEMYDVVHSPQKHHNLEYSPRVFNPTNLSSRFQAV